MFEDEPQEFYEEPDYNVWETNRVYEDMALEREQAEADAEAEALEGEVLTIVEGIADELPGMSIAVIERIVERTLRFQREREEAREAEDEALVELSRPGAW